MVLVTGEMKLIIPECYKNPEDLAEIEKLRREAEKTAALNVSRDDISDYAYIDNLLGRLKKYESVFGHTIRRLQDMKRKMIY